MPRFILIEDILDAPFIVFAASSTMEEMLEPDVRLFFENSDSYSTPARYFNKGNIIVFKDAMERRFFYSTPEHPVQFLTLDEFLLANGIAPKLANFFDKQPAK